VSNNDSSLNTKVSLVLNSSYSYLISVLAAASSAWGVETVIISFLELFEGPTADLLTAVFLSIVVWALGNFKQFFFKSNSLYIS
jgi:hypothetical protein